MKRTVTEILGLAAFAAICLTAAIVLMIRPIETAAVAPFQNTLHPSALQQTTVPSRIVFPVRTSAIVARPLFAKSRRPFQPEAAIAPAPPIEPPSAPEAQLPIMAAETLVLKGVFLHATTARALIASASNPDGTWLEAGAEIEGWKLQHIEREMVRLGRASHSTELKLYTNGGQP